MKIMLFDNNANLVSVYKKWFGDEFPFVEIFYGDFKDIKGYEGIVSPANSFGFMDGGIDMAYSKYFGWDVQKELQKKILLEKDGELLVGDGLVVDMSTIPTYDIDTDFRFMISVPTMRVPMNVNRTANAYLAMRAVLRLAEANNIRSVAVPGLATGVGAVEPHICAKQIYTAVALRYKLDLPKFSLPNLREQCNFHEWLTTPYSNYITGYCPLIKMIMQGREIR